MFGNTREHLAVLFREAMDMINKEIAEKDAQLKTKFPCNCAGGAKHCGTLKLVGDKEDKDVELTITPVKVIESESLSVCLNEKSIKELIKSLQEIIL